MATIVTRAGKGTPLTFEEVDGNFTNLNTDKIENVVEDATPQLGGNLDLNGYNVTGTGNVNITGNITLTGTVDGRDVAADGALAASALQDVSDDTTPTLGGTLDADNNDITNAGTITAAQYDSTEALPDIKPSLNLDFANVKRLDPRITYTRASTGTYYDGKTFAKAEENLLVRSQEFNATWIDLATTRSGDTEVAPDGTTTADTITEDDTASPHRIRQVASASGAVVLSVFAKAGSGSRYLTIGVNNSTANFASATFDLSAGTNTQTFVNGTYSSESAAISSVAGGFYRCSLSVTVDSLSEVLIGLSATSTFSNVSRGFDSYTGDDTSSIYLWGAQLEQRDALTDYTPTTTQPITNYIPALQTAASGVARFDHDPITSESLGFLIEEQRTNVLTYSEDFSDSDWPKDNSSITSNTIVAPDGTLTGDKLVEDATTNQHSIGQTLTLTANTTYVMSAYVKPAGRTLFRLAGRFVNNWSVAGPKAEFDLAAGTVSGIVGDDAGIQDVGNGWYRCYLVATFGASNASGGINLIPLITTTSSIYTGDGYSGVYLWGAQLEAGAFPTSYIKTTTAQATRNADAASMTGTNFSEWYNAGEGTVYVDSATSANVSTIYAQFRLDDSNITSLDHDSGFIRLVNFYNSSATAVLNLGSVGNAGDPLRLAAAYKVNDFAGVKDAGTVQTDTSGNLAAGVNSLQIGRSGNTVATTYISGPIKKLAYYPQRLSNATLQALTEE